MINNLGNYIMIGVLLAMMIIYIVASIHEAKKSRATDRINAYIAGNPCGLC